MNLSGIQEVQARASALQKECFDVVAELGDKIGFGNLMTLASQAWGEAHPGGGEFMVGTCRSMTVDCLCRGKGEGSANCNWCCGSGWLTPTVRDLIVSSFHAELAEERNEEITFSEPRVDVVNTIKNRATAVVDCFEDDGDGDHFMKTILVRVEVFKDGEINLVSAERLSEAARAAIAPVMGLVKRERL